MNVWPKFNTRSLPEKMIFYRHLNMKDADADTDYTHAKKVCENFEIKNLGEYHDLYVQSDTLVLADIFNNFRNMWSCSICEYIDPAHFLSSPGFAWQPSLRRTKIKLYLLTDIDMFLMVEKGIRGGTCNAIH